MRILAQISRYFVGILFIISGFVKLVDPMGTAIKLEEYFYVFSQDFFSGFESLIPASMFFSFSFLVAEVILGLVILLLYRIKITAWIAFGLIVFFTFLTGYSAYTHNVTDCGCFGDAVTLTPLQSFFKDLVLLVLTGIIVLYRKQFIITWNDRKLTLIVGISTVLAFIFSWYNYQYLPVIDFRSYSKGANLDSLTHDGSPDKYMYEFEKIATGDIVKSKKYLKEGYKYIGYEIEKGDLPTIPDFVVTNKEGINYNPTLFKGEKLIITGANIKNKADFIAVDKYIKTQLNILPNKGLKIVYLTSVSFDVFESFLKESNIYYDELYNLDATAIKAMIRSNPGIILMNDAIVIQKWHLNNLKKVKVN